MQPLSILFAETCVQDHGTGARRRFYAETSVQAAPQCKLLQEEASKGVVRVGELHHAVEQSGKIPKSDQMAVGQLIMLAAAQVR
jgi:hypothetical protein